MLAPRDSIHLPTWSGKRNLARRLHALARGDAIVFLSQDCEPSAPHAVKILAAALDDGRTVNALALRSAEIRGQRAGSRER